MEANRRSVTLGPLVAPTIHHAPAELDDMMELFAVHWDEVLSAKIMQHAVRFDNTEVFGLLLGDVVQTPSGRLRTIIRDFITAEHLQESTATFVEVSAAELIRMDERYELMKERSGLLKVGWFHTHPGHGIFMSQTDRDNHLLYSKSWQVALVLDPKRKTLGFFAGADCKPVHHISPIGVRPNRVDGGSSSSPVVKYRAWMIGLLLLQLGVLWLAVLTFANTRNLSRRVRSAEDRLNRIQKAADGSGKGDTDIDTR